MEGMEYDRVWTMSMDNTIDLHSLLIVTAVIKEKLGILEGPREPQAFHQPRYHSRSFFKNHIIRDFYHEYSYL